MVVHGRPGFRLTQSEESGVGLNGVLPALLALILTWTFAEHAESAGCPPPVPTINLSPPPCRRHPSRELGGLAYGGARRPVPALSSPDHHRYVCRRVHYSDRGGCCGTAPFQPRRSLRWRWGVRLGSRDLTRGRPPRRRDAGLPVGGVISASPSSSRRASRPGFRERRILPVSQL